MTDTVRNQDGVDSFLHRGTEDVFYVVSTSRFVLFSLCTLGLYERYWAYRNWGIIAARTGAKLSPFTRAIFMPLWTYRLCKYVKVCSREHRVDSKVNASGVALGYFVLELAWRLPAPFVLFGFLTFLPLLSVLETMRALNKSGFGETSIGTSEHLYEGAYNSKASRLDPVPTVAGGPKALLRRQVEKFVFPWATSFAKLDLDKRRWHRLALVLFSVFTLASFPVFWVILYSILQPSYNSSQEQNTFATFAESCLLGILVTMLISYLLQVAYRALIFVIYGPKAAWPSKAAESSSQDLPTSVHETTQTEILSSVAL